MLMNSACVESLITAVGQTEEYGTVILFLFTEIVLRKAPFEIKMWAFHDTY